MWGVKKKEAIVHSGYSNHMENTWTNPLKGFNKNNIYWMYIICQVLYKAWIISVNPYFKNSVKKLLATSHKDDWEN